MDVLSSSQLLFSYGTLQRGERAHHHLASAAFLGEARTADTFLLVDCGQFPGLVAVPSSSPVCGELYRIPYPLWPTLDDYEGIHLGEYHRTLICIIHADHGEIAVQAYLWARPWKHLPVVGACWKTYRRRYFPTP